MKRNQYYRPANRNHMRKQNHAFAIFAIMAAVLMLIGVSAKACDGVYFKIGAGHKFEEDRYFTVGEAKYNKTHVSSVSARFELGARIGHLHIGVAHGSQWSTGFPKSDEGEPYRSEIFADYRFDLWDF